MSTKAIYNNIFYVYVHINPETNEIFYVGKGKEDRAYSTSRHQYWKDFVKPILEKYNMKDIVHFICINQPEDVAYKYETMYISYYGRVDLGTGSLINRTSGGAKPRQLSKKSRKAMGRDMSGKNNPMYGRKQSKKSKVNIGLKSEGRNAGAKLSEKEVKEILKLYNKQIKLDFDKNILTNKRAFSKKYCFQYNIIDRSLYNIVTRKTWSHVEI